MEKALDSNAYEKVGMQMADQLWQSRKILKQNKPKLESPSSIEEYHNAFPPFLVVFFNAFISVITKKKLAESNRKNKTQELSEPTDNIRTIKIVLFLVSVFVVFAFPALKVWLPQVMASLCQKPRLLSSFHALLAKCSVIAHTNRHERRVEKIRIGNVEPTKRLIKGENVFNLAVIDNIDFKEKTF